jgi:hypothetical protein
MQRFILYLAAIEVFLVPLVENEVEEGSSNVLLCVEISTGSLERDVTLVIGMEDVSGLADALYTSCQ